MNTRSLSDLVIHGLTSNRIWIFLGGLAPFYDNIVNKGGELLAGIGLVPAEIFSLEVHAWWQIGLYALSLTMLVMLVLVTFSVAGSIMSFYGYTLSKLDDRYIRRSGLFTRHEVSMKLSRLQMIVSKQDWLDRLLKRVNLKFEQSNANFKNMEPGAANNRIIVPSVRPYECQNLIDDAYPDNRLASIPFNGVSKFYILRFAVYLWLPLHALVAGLMFFNDNFAGLAFVVASFAAVVLIVGVHWKRWGYGWDENFVYVRKGFVGMDYYCFPIHKIQQTQFKQSVFMRRRKLATVNLILASGKISIPFMPQDKAYELINRCLYKVEAQKQSWM